jgi:hypothetical protein
MNGEMKTWFLLAPAILFVNLGTSGQDWQHCQLDGAGSFQQVKEAVHRWTSMHVHTSFDEKSFSRFGDITSVAVLQCLNDNEMTNPQTLGNVLSIIRSAFGCPSRCVMVPDDQKPRVTLLLLDQLHDHTRGPSQLAVDETKKFVIQQVNGIN